ncbi:hypothetical protein H0H81_011895 [Sphagnurus paluster]|uniref:Uncharacterized protein n=1 Tax=Sphagnurus paluster TaxID=117069 RepID=A0A9P7FTW6_9AGAR|nr:hypothetical protein H0H81_011895 [Sphagnurus paluster]
MTPHSSRTHHHPYIRSSPAFGSEISSHAHSDYIDDHAAAWARLPPVRAPVTLPGFKSFFCDDLPAPKALTAPIEHLHHTLPQPQPKPTQYAPVFSDSEEEPQEEDDDGGYSFVEENTRATFFRTSAERGQWRFDPTPLKFEPLRRSAPTSSPPPVSGLHLLLRPISEPAPSTGRVSHSPEAHEPHKEDCELPSASSDAALSESEPEPDHLRSSLSACDRTCSLPSLESDRDSVEPEDLMCPSSPLPPSSPPMSSSPMLHSMSPLSFAPSSPHLAPSSPLSFIDSLPPTDDLEHDPDHEMEVDVGADVAMEAQAPSDDEPGTTVPTPHPQGALALLDVPQCIVQVQGQVRDPDGDAAETIPILIPASIADPEEAAQAPVPAAAPVPEPKAEFEPEPCLLPNGLELDADKGVTILEGKAESAESPVVESSLLVSPLLPLPSPSLALSEEIPEVEECVHDDDDVTIGAEEPPTAGASTSDLVEPGVTVATDALPEKEVENGCPGPFSVGEGKVELEALKPKDENGVASTSANSSVPKKEKRRRDRERERERDGPAKKKARVGGEDSVLPVAQTREPQKKKPGREKRRLVEEEVDGEDEENRREVVVPVVKKKQRRASEAPSKRSGKSTPPKPISTTCPPKPQPPQDPGTQALDAEIFGMLIESMATSRASCLPVSTLLKSVMQSRPSMRDDRTEGEWRVVVERVLNSGEASMGGSGVFGKVESSFKDDSDRPLDAQWFYVPELDEDQDRATLIRSMMPRPGKRSTTKKYKQYYYRPLDKISRWDHEDEM